MSDLAAVLRWLNAAERFYDGPIPERMRCAIFRADEETPESRAAGALTGLEFQVTHWESRCADIWRWVKQDLARAHHWRRQAEAANTIIKRRACLDGAKRDRKSARQWLDALPAARVERDKARQRLAAVQPAAQKEAAE